MMKTSGRRLFTRAFKKSLSLAATVGTILSCAQVSLAESQDQVEAKVASLLSKLTLDEKITLLSGTKDEMHVPGVKRLGIPELKFSDGPVGVRVWGKATAYPAGAMLASTWDQDMAQAVGKALGRDSRARGVHVLLAPGVDLYRVPQCGRNFEYFGEDPYLSSKITVGYIKGVEGEHVGTSVKHYAANDQEILRDSVDTIVDERRLHEICFPPFKAAVKEANVSTFMAAYNKVNGEWCTANTYLLTDVLRKQWGFKGIMMSDWGAVHDCLGPLNAGTDLEMGKTTHYTADNIKRFLQEGKVTQETIDEHVRRILRVEVAMNWLNTNQEDKSIPLNDPSSVETALKAAREGMVLLRNQNDLLPLSRDKAKSVVVLGPNACPAVTGGGGSSGTDSFSYVSLLDAVSAVAGNNVKVYYIPSWVGANPTASSAYNVSTVFEPMANGERGVKAEYFGNTDLSGSPALTRTDTELNFQWGSWHPCEQISTATFSARWTGKIKAAQTDSYMFSCSSDGAKVLMDGKVLLDCSASGGLKNNCKIIKMQTGETHDIVIEYRHLAGPATMEFTWNRANEQFTPEEQKLISEADAVVASVGFNRFLESEGFDRPYDLPAEQVDLIKNVSHLNPKTVVVLNAGGNVGMEKWIDDVSGLIHAWYPGQNGNTAVAEAIFGDLNPSGRLPDTFEKRWEDSPAFGNYPGSADNGGKVEYKEGIYVGYRWYDKKNIAPRYPFGFGLSYTNYSMQNLKLEKQGNNFIASVDVTNTGRKNGTEVVQLYVRPLATQLDRPVQELKGFSRVSLEPGETKTVSMTLTPEAFATYDIKAHSWVTPAGQYEIAIGSSSRDIHCSQTVKVD